MQLKAVPVVLSLCGALIFVSDASAQIRLDLDVVFDGFASPPANPDTPWLTAVFEARSAGQVQFTLEATGNLSGAENVKAFYFNFDDTLDLNALQISHIGSSGAFTLPVWTLAENSLKAGSDGRHDIRLDFTTGTSLGQTFGRYESVSYLLTYSGAGVMNEHSFSFLSLPTDGTGPFLAVAHVQNTTDGGSVWLAADATALLPVPEPSTAALLTLLSLSLLGRRQIGLLLGGSEPFKAGRA